MHVLSRLAHLHFPPKPQSTAPLFRSGDTVFVERGGGFAREIDSQIKPTPYSEGGVAFVIGATVAANRDNQLFQVKYITGLSAVKLENNVPHTRIKPYILSSPTKRTCTKDSKMEFNPKELVVKNEPSTSTALVPKSKKRKLETPSVAKFIQHLEQVRPLPEPKKLLVNEPIAQVTRSTASVNNIEVNAAPLQPLPNASSGTTKSVVEIQKECFACKILEPKEHPLARYLKIQQNLCPEGWLRQSQQSNHEGAKTAQVYLEDWEMQEVFFLIQILAPLNKRKGCSPTQDLAYAYSVKRQTIHNIQQKTLASADFTPVQKE